MKPWKTIAASAAAVLFAALLNALLSRLFFLKLQSILWINTLGGMLLLSAAPAVILYLAAKLTGRFISDGKHLANLVPPAFFFAAILPWTTPITGNNDTFLWYYQAILAFGAFGWSLILFIIQFAVTIFQKHRALKADKELPHIKQKEKCK